MVRQIVATLLFSSLVALPSLAYRDRVQILEDTPGMLRLKVVPGEYSHSAGPAGTSWQCAGCDPELRIGAPRLPWLRFQILVGPHDLPQISFHAAGYSSVAGVSIAPVPGGTPDAPEYVRDAEHYSSAAGPQVQIGERRVIRGRNVRSVALPLFRLEGDKLDLVREATVTIHYEASAGRPAELEESLARWMMNPNGGRWVLDSPIPKAVAKRSAAPVSAFGSKWFKLTIGDNVPGDWAEDAVYGVAFKDLAAESDHVVGMPMSRLQLFTGPHDSLPVLPAESDVVEHRLREVPFWTNDINGTFDSGDTLFFFAQGTSIWKKVEGAKNTVRYRFAANPYSFERHYYLTNGGSPESAKRVSWGQGPYSAPSVATSSYSYLRLEKDLDTKACNPSRTAEQQTGKIWHWHWKSGEGEGNCHNQIDQLLVGNQLTTDYYRGLPGYVPDSILLGFHVHPNNDGADFEVFIDGDRARSVDSMDFRGSWYVWDRPLVATGEGVIDSLLWRDNNRFEGYTIAYRRAHSHLGRPFYVFPSAPGRQGYRFEDSDLSVLRVREGIADRGFRLDITTMFSDSLEPEPDVVYFVYRSNEVRALGTQAIVAETRIVEGGIEAAMAATTPEYLIIAPQSLLPQAQELARFRSEAARATPISARVVRVDDIYRYYSGGRLSPVAIRDFIRNQYWTGSGSTPSALKHVLLFGDGHFNYRNISTSLEGRRYDSFSPNLIPPYEVEDMATDDFYALMDESDELGTSNSTPDLGVGRLPLQTVAEAKAYLNKIKAYEEPANGGVWRNRVVMTADDSKQRDKPDAITQGHTNDTEKLANRILEQEPGKSVEKVYLLDYPANAAYQKPSAAQDLLNHINRGSLLINYVGHGSSTVWADEGLLQTNFALPRLTNVGRNTIINSFSCTVGRFEKVTEEGLSETFVKADRVGAIAAVSATRESFPLPNIALAEKFYTNLFRAGQVVTIGEALQLAKAELSNYQPDNNEKYGLFGEPVLLARKPSLELALETFPDTLQALSCDTITGTVTGGSGTGNVHIRIQSGDVSKEYEVPEGMAIQYAEKRGSILYEAVVPYVSGRFKADYLIPKKVPYGDSTAKITLFAWDGNRELEGSHLERELWIKGTANSCPADDGKGPQIRVTGCESDQSGNLDFPAEVSLPLPYCLQIEVRDSLGGVLSADSPDEGTVLEFPGVLAPFHPVPRIDELHYKSYNYTLEGNRFLPAKHLLKVSAQDGYGNVSTRTVQLNLQADSALNLVRAFNVPNPMKGGSTTFYFSATAPSDQGELRQEFTGALEFEVRVFDQRGQLVRVFENAVSGESSWNGRDAWGNIMANGIYYYKVIAKQEKDALQRDVNRMVSRRSVIVISR